jgi:hypothetical protein
VSSRRSWQGHTGAEEEAAIPGKQREENSPSRDPAGYRSTVLLGRRRQLAAPPGRREAVRRSAEEDGVAGGELRGGSTPLAEGGGSGGLNPTAR